MIAIILMYLIVAFAFIIAKISLQYASPYFTVAFRCLAAGSSFLLFQFLFDRKNFFIKREDILFFLKTSFFYIYLVFIPEFWALEKLRASKVILIYALTPFFVALFAYFLVKERFTLKKILGMIIGLAGMMAIFITKDASGNGAEFFYVSAREAALLVSVASYAYSWFLIKRLREKKYTLAMINGSTMIIGGIGALATSFLTEGAFAVSNAGKFFPLALIFTFLTNIVFYSMYGWLLRHYSFTFLSFASFLGPVFGIAFGWYLLSEVITWYHFVSLILISLGLTIFCLEELRKKDPDTISPMP